MVIGRRFNLTDRLAEDLLSVWCRDQPGSFVFKQKLLERSHAAWDSARPIGHR